MFARPLHCFQHCRHCVHEHIHREVGGERNESAKLSQHRVFDGGVGSSGGGDPRRPLGLVRQRCDAPDPRHALQTPMLHAQAMGRGAQVCSVQGAQRLVDRHSRTTARDESFACQNHFQQRFHDSLGIVLVETLHRATRAHDRGSDTDRVETRTRVR